MEIRAPKGTKDILPHESGRWDRFINAVEGVFRSYGYARIETPAFESEALYVRAIGQGTDIVNKEMYIFKDKGGRSMALRPEETAGVVRAYIEHKMHSGSELTKVFYRGPMFRYERPQGGRQRQFWQIGVEALGSADPALDAETIELAYRSLTRAGLEDLEVAVNSVGCEKCRPGYSDALRGFLTQESEELCKTCADRTEINPMRVFDCKNEACRKTLEKAPLITDHLCEECEISLAKVKDYLDALAVPYREEARLVRGLDYYTRTAFEITGRGLGAQDAVAAGGRYDGLVAAYGGPATPAIGFAIGVERALLSIGGAEAAKEQGPDAYLIALNDEAKKACLALAAGLREADLTVVTDFSGKSLKKQMSNADKAGAKHAVIVGEEELMTGSLTVRDMETGEQTGVGAADLAEALS